MFLFGFGKFRVAERAARKGRNPRTGEAVKMIRHLFPRQCLLDYSLSTCFNSSTAGGIISPIPVHTRSVTTSS